MARGILMGEDGVFRLVGGSQGRDGHLLFGVAGGESEGGRGSSMLGPGPEVGGGGSAWMEAPMDGNSLVPTTEADDDDALSFDQLLATTAAESMPPPPLPSSHALGLFSHRHHYQEEQDSYLGFGDAGAFDGSSAGLAGEASAEDEAFRSAMKEHWYRSRC